ncbi:MAG: VOC family protein [Ectothiorhodospiraceae bacterium]
MDKELRPFHLAFPVTDLEATRTFYRDVLGCGVGRETRDWIDFDFHGHQISAHRVARLPDLPTNDVDGCQVPVCHFGLVLSRSAWDGLVERLRASDSVRFLIEPHVRFNGEPGEQATCFITDPSGNGLEFKAFKDESEVFSRE